MGKGGNKGRSTGYGNGGHRLPKYNGGGTYNPQGRKNFFKKRKKKGKGK